jgi:eukaryotic-like serine/threonine-protein kinase
MVGRRLLHFDVLEKLGEGGMGVVYKARDSHLDRFVAIKVLPSGAAADPERRQRFIQEAKAASALQHPNIVTVHDVGEADGLDFIVMELVTGTSLGALIPRKGLRLGLALSYAVQVAGAMARAHGAGIIHRDLKPANVMVDDHGLVKVLDFGLAKLTEPAGADNAATEARTAQGAVMGTAAYMSPEQAEGKPVDARSDVFSFGSMLYEMLTGRRAFHGDSTASTIASVLREEPVPVGQLVDGLPREVEKIIRRCLRKDPDHRFQTMADLRVALEELKEEADSGELPAPQPGKSERSWWPLAAAVLVCLVAASSYFFYPRHRDLPSPVVRPLTDFVGTERSPALSSDGKRVAFSWNGVKGEPAHIYVKEVNSETSLPLTKGADFDTAPAWSPDDSQVAFIRIFEDHASIFVTSPLGGPEKKVADFTPDFNPLLVINSRTALSWSPNGEWLIVVERKSASESALLLVPVHGGSNKRLLSSPVSERYFLDAAFSPDGSSLAYVACEGERSCDLYLQELDRAYAPRGSSKRLTKEGAIFMGLAWMPDGRSIVASLLKGQVAASRMVRASVSGSEAVEWLAWVGEAIEPSVSKSGTLAFVRSAQVNSPSIWRFRPGSPAEKWSSSTSVEFDPQFSPRGDRVAFGSSRSGKGAELWVARHDGSSPMRLTEGEEESASGARWSPEGRWIVYNAQAQGGNGRWEVFRIDAAGGPVVNLTNSAADENLPSYSADGRWVYFTSNRTGRYEVYRMPAAGGQAQRFTDGGGFEALESADGQTVYYTKGWFTGLYSRPAAGGAETPVLPSVSLPVLSFAVFKEGIYYMQLIGVRHTGPLQFMYFDFATRTSKELMRSEVAFGQGLTVSPDGSTMLCVAIPERTSDLAVAEHFR